VFLYLRRVDNTFGEEVGYLLYADIIKKHDALSEDRVLFVRTLSNISGKLEKEGRRVWIVILLWNLYESVRQRLLQQQDLWGVVMKMPQTMQL
jgi:hypothetical protein